MSANATPPLGSAPRADGSELCADRGEDTSAASRPLVAVSASPAHRRPGSLMRYAECVMYDHRGRTPTWLPPTPRAANADDALSFAELAALGPIGFVRALLTGERTEPAQDGSGLLDTQVILRTALRGRRRAFAVVTAAGVLVGAWVTFQSFAQDGEVITDILPAAAAPTQMAPAATPPPPESPPEAIAPAKPVAASNAQPAAVKRRRVRKKKGTVRRRGKRRRGNRGARQRRK